MGRNLLTSPQLLKDAAHRKKEPEFAAAVRELELAHRHADEMLADGKLTEHEHAEFEAYLYGQFIEALPVAEFEKLVENGGMDHLQSLAGYEGRRDAGDVEDARKVIVAKIKADALDAAWLEGRIDSKYYAEQSRDIEQHHDEDMDKRIADEDYDGAAAEYFVLRNDVSDHEDSLISYLKGKYGDGDAPGPDTPRNSSSDAPPGYVEHNQMPFASENYRDNTSSDGIVSHDDDEEG